jgi:hypothetical protein
VDDRERKKYVEDNQQAHSIQHRTVTGPKLDFTSTIMILMIERNQEFINNMLAHDGKIYIKYYYNVYGYEQPYSSYGYSAIAS